jgi:hypothetical protein
MIANVAAMKSPYIGKHSRQDVTFPLIPETGKDAFHRVPDSARNEWDAVERVLTISALQ